MPLDMRMQAGAKQWHACQIEKCFKYASKRVYFMGHDMGKVCMTHAAEWRRAWEGALATDKDA